MIKRRKTLKKMKTYFEQWDTADYKYVHIMTDGRLIQTNNVDLAQICLTKGDFGRLIKYIEQNT